MPDFGVRPDASPLALVGVGDSHADAMTVQQCGDDPPVEKMPRSSRELIGRSPLGYGNLAVPVALEAKACWVIRSTPPAIVVPHLVLERLTVHGAILTGPSAQHHRPLPDAAWVGIHSCALGGDAMDTEAGLNGEASVQLLFLRTEVPGRVGHRNDLWLIDFVCLPIGQNGGRFASEDVLHPIGPFAVREGDQKAVLVLNRHNRGLVAPTRAASNVTDDRGAGLFCPS